MSHITVHEALLVITFAIAITTTILRGKQWPTLITAAVFGCFLGSTSTGLMIIKLVKEAVNAFLSLTNMGN